jgi:glycosyltransferase involved in cell wall biosynthesis
LGALPADIHEIIIVDGHSTDDTLAVVRKLRPDARIVMQTRTGKGNALACGCAAATGEIIAMIDADGSTDAREIPSFVSALLDGADFAKGTRFAKGGGSEDITRLRGLGNRILTGIVNLLYGTKYTDLCYGFNALWQRHLSVLGFDTATILAADKSGCPWGDGFEIETLINIRIATAGLAVAEVPSFERARIYGVSNLSAFSDGIRVLRTILYERFIVSRQGRRFPARAPLDKHEQRDEASPADVAGRAWAGSDSSAGPKEDKRRSTVSQAKLASGLRLELASAGRLRLRVFAVAGRIALGGRRLRLRFAERWPWAGDITTAMTGCRPSPPADQPEHPCGQEGETTRDRGTPPTRRDSRAVTHISRPKSHPSPTPQATTRGSRNIEDSGPAKSLTT